MTYSGPVLGFAIMAGLVAVLILAILVSKVSGDIANVRIAKHTGQDGRAHADDLALDESSDGEATG